MLAFMSSNAVTLAEAAIACHDLAGLLTASTVIAALSHLAVRRVGRALCRGGAASRPSSRPDTGRAGRCASCWPTKPGRRLGCRIPTATGRCRRCTAQRSTHMRARMSVLVRELNSAAENPLIDVGGQRIWHNGELPHRVISRWRWTRCARPCSRPAPCRWRGSARCWTTANTGLTPFLAMDTPPSSGLMIVEYAAHSALADIRRLAAPVVLGGAVLSVGAEEHAGLRDAGGLVGDRDGACLPGRAGMRACRRGPGAAAARHPPGRPRARASLRPC